MTNLNSALKSRGINLLTKVRIVKAMVFPVVMCRGKSWTIKKAEQWRIHAFELWCQRRLFRVSWTARKSNQSILKEMNPEYTLEGLVLKLKLQNFSHLVWRANLPEKARMLGKIEGKRRRGWHGWDGWHHQLNGHEFEQFWEIVKDSEAWCAAIHGVAKSWTWLRAWTTMTFIHNGILLSHKK